MKEVKTPKKPLAYYYGIVLIVLIVFNLVVTPILMEHQVKETDYGTFMSMIEKKNIGEVEVEDNQIIFTDKDQKNIYKTGLMNDPNLTDRLYECGAVFAKDIDKQMSPIISFLLTGVLPLILFIALGNYMAKKLMEHAGGKNSMAFGMGKSNAKIYVQSSEGIRFSDVAGEDEAKENLSEIVDYLHNPKKYTDVGASMPKGVLLVGPPGTGKTMLAKAVAGESNVPFFSMSGSEFVEMFVGMGASKVRDLFGQAKEKAPCIVFIDEIDAIGKKRDGQMGGNDERDWAIRIPGKKPVRSRNQLLLDFSRKEVRDCVFDQICAVLDQGKIDYVKWDMNRSMADVYAGNLSYDYVLGVYDFLEHLCSRYPDLLLEGCSGGGGRFDAGMLYYSPQIWCSDNTRSVMK